MIFSQKKYQADICVHFVVSNHQKNVSSVKRVDMRPRGVISSYSRA